MAIKILTDTSCDLPDETLNKYNIEMIPLKVTFDHDQTFLDRFEISPAMFLKNMRGSKNLPKTSAPDPAAFVSCFEKGLKEFGKVMFISISSGLSSTYQTALLASKMIDNENIRLFDSLTASLGTGIAAINAAEMAGQGFSIETIEEELMKLRQSREVLFTLDTLENVVKGGRLSKFQGMVGTVLDIKPIFRGNSQGMVEVVEKVVGRKKAIHRLTAMLGELYDKNQLKDKLIGISHVACLEEAQHFARAVMERYQPQREIIIADMGATIGTYAGVGGLMVNVF